MEVIHVIVMSKERQRLRHLHAFYGNLSYSSVIGDDMEQIRIGGISNNGAGIRGIRFFYKDLTLPTRVLALRGWKESRN
jgi:hypothetical protein